MTKQKKATQTLTKIGIIAKFFDAIMEVVFFAGFDVIFLEKKRAMLLPSQKKRNLLHDSDLKIAHKNWIFSKYNVVQIR